jgi:hypothetical protein
MLGELVVAGLCAAGRFGAAGPGRFGAARSGSA